MTIADASLDTGAEPAVVSAGRPKSPWRRAKPVVLALIVPLLLLAFWQVATTERWTLLIPTPYAVAEYMVDFAVGGIYDDAFSATILTHVWKSMTRVYGGFFLAALIGIPLGLMIGRIKLVRQLLDPTSAE